MLSKQCARNMPCMLAPQSSFGNYWKVKRIHLRGERRSTSGFGFRALGFALQQASKGSRGQWREWVNN